MADASSYPLRNSEPDEAARLAKLQALHDDDTVARLVVLGVGEGWRCLELGAGAGSIARWLSERVGRGGSVTAVDRDTSQLEDLQERGNVIVEKHDIATMAFPSEAFDLVHSRSVLMHVPEADDVVVRVVDALRPGGWVLLEEADGAPVATAVSPPDPFVQVMAPLAARWTWARGIADTLRSLGLCDVRESVRASPLAGGSPGAEFWQHTLRSVRGALTDPSIAARTGGARQPVDDATVDAMIALLDDPSFVVPFVARHAVTGRRPVPGPSR